MNNFFVSTGEVSGDLHLSYIIEKILKEDKEAKFYGVIGEHSKKVGAIPIQDIKELAVMGFVEALKKYNTLKKKAKEYIEFIKKEKINKVILVDYGGFNLRFLELLKKEIPNIEVFFYIPPKLWIWGENRIHKLKLADHIVVIFPWEVEFYKKHNIEAIYYGNPFTEKYQYVKKFETNVLLLPGSRKQEIKAIFPEMLDVIKKMPEKNFILKLSSEQHLKWIDENLEKYNNLKIEFKEKLEKCVEKCEVAIATSGTVTLELALLGIPTIVVYKTSFINVFIAKYILKVGFISLPNLTLNQEVFPELIQERCNSSEIIKEIKKILKNKDELNLKILEIRKALTGKGLEGKVLESYAKFILKDRKNEKIQNI